MRLLVFGATGGTGHAVMIQAAARGHAVTAFVRRPDALEDLPARVRVLKGEVMDAAQVAAACANHDAVISSLGTRPWRHTDVCSQGTRNIVAGMLAHEVKRVVVVSSLGVGDSFAHSSFLSRLFFRMIRRALADKALMEQALRESSLDWVVTRPTLLGSGAATGRVRAADDGSIRAGRIRRADVAAFCLDQLESDAWLRRLPVITGG